VVAATVRNWATRSTPDEFAELTEIDGITQAPYFAKRHWVRMADPLGRAVGVRARIVDFWPPRSRLTVIGRV
jgi:hypothetical protein